MDVKKSVAKGSEKFSFTFHYKTRDIIKNFIQPEALALLRSESRNRGVGVMVGGRLFAEKPELANAVGADATATDGRQAALQAETLLALLATRN